MAKKRIDGGWHVPSSALDADRLARQKGRVRMLNGALEGGMEDWTLPLEQWMLVRKSIHEAIDMLAEEDGTVALKDIVAFTQDRLGDHPAFPGGRLRNITTYTKVDLEARHEVIRIAGSSPQRIRAARPPGDGSDTTATGATTPR